MVQICDMGFGEKLEKLREKRGISVRETARQVGGVAPNTVERWISGKVQPRLDEAIRAAEVFGVPLDYLAFDERAEPAGMLAEDEAHVLQTYRSLKRRRKLDADAAVEGLMLVARLPLADDTPATIHPAATLPRPAPLPPAGLSIPGKPEKFVPSDPPAKRSRRKKV
jgi:transcriptional regulator with XRE-family HTH domain